MSTRTAQITVSESGISGDARTVAIPRRSRVPWGAVGRHTVLLLLCFWVLFPLIIVVINSVESRVESVQRNIWPREFVSPIWARYEWVWRDFTLDNIFFRVYWNSLFVTALTVTFGTVAAILAGYAFHISPRRANRVIMLVLVASLFFPVQVTSMMGVFQLHWDLGLIDETWALMFPYVAASTAISIFIMRAVFQMISPELLTRPGSTAPPRSAFWSRSCSRWCVTASWSWSSSTSCMPGASTCSPAY